MSNSKKWVLYFTQNLQQQRINWNTIPAITRVEIATILPSLQAWQLGETSDGNQLLDATAKYALATDDPAYADAVSLFIKEEQKHGNNLGRYLDCIGEERIKRNWGDTLFRKIRHLNTSMEWWTLAVITVESAAQVFYQSLKDATGCPLLRQVCTDILIDEAYHIDFQAERMSMIYRNKPATLRWLRRLFYKLFYFTTILVVWMAHKKVFEAGGNNFKRYLRKMTLKYRKTLGRIDSKMNAVITGENNRKGIRNLEPFLQSAIN